MDNIKFDVNKDIDIAVPVPEMSRQIYKNMPKFIVGIVGHPRTLTQANKIKNRLKLDNLNMIQLLENVEMPEGLIKVSYNQGKEKEIDLNAES